MVLKIVLIALLYYPLSIGLTFYQKWFIKNYKLPLFVVCWHYIVKYVAAISIRFLYEVLRKKRIRLQLKDQLRWLAPIGICASLDIGLSNWALEYVTVSLYTMAKSSSILFIVAFALLLRLERWRATLGLEAALIASGLFLFTWHSSQLDLTGLLLVELAASCTGVRWTVSARSIMQREGAGFDILRRYEYLLLVNTSGITLNIFGILKEVATLLLAHILNNDRLSWVNLAGLTLCLFGMALHGMTRKRQRYTT
ncbi:hypothetical protein OSTOST_12042 [Ostertagia ostertagi]